MKKENYICIFGKIIELTVDQIRKIKEVFDEPVHKLSEIKPGEVFKLGEHEFMVLEHCGGETAVIYKSLLRDSEKFGEKNNFDGSIVDRICQEFAQELAGIVGEENLVEHTVALTSDDGLKDYGEIERRVSLLTTEQYRKYVEILDQHKPDTWWWLATPHSTARHCNDRWVKCVAPDGFVNNFFFYGYYGGVRPFCIFKSNIFVS